METNRLLTRRIFHTNRYPKEKQKKKEYLIRKWKKSYRLLLVSPGNSSYQGGEAVASILSICNTSKSFQVTCITWPLHRAFSTQSRSSLVCLARRRELRELCGLGGVKLHHDKTRPGTTHEGMVWEGNFLGTSMNSEHTSRSLLSAIMPT